MKAEIAKTVEQDEKTDKNTGDNLGKADEQIKDITKRLTAASNGITAPDKLAALARIKRKLNDASGTKDKLKADEGKESASLKDAKTSLTSLNPETPISALLTSLGDLEKKVTPLDSDIKDTNQQSGDLLKSLADLNAELDDFNKNG